MKNTLHAVHGGIGTIGSVIIEVLKGLGEPVRLLPEIQTLTEFKIEMHIY